MAQSQYGQIKIFDDFTGGFEAPVAGTTAPPINFGSFQLVGQGLADTDSGAVGLDSDGLNGVVQLTTTNEDIHAAGLASRVAFDVGLMGTVVYEARVRMPAQATGEVFVGFSDVQTDLAIIEGAICHGATTTLTLTASDICGFLFSDDLTSKNWHAVFNGGTTTGVTDATANDLGSTALPVNGEFDVLRLEITNSGTVRWYVNGKLLKTVTGGVSTSVDVGALTIVESKTTTVLKLDVDYIALEANRDWTV
jgi:hypothetical protein